MEKDKEKRKLNVQAEEQGETKKRKAVGKPHPSKMGHHGTDDEKKLNPEE